MRDDDSNLDPFNLIIEIPLSSRSELSRKLSGPRRYSFINEYLDFKTEKERKREGERTREERKEIFHYPYFIWVDVKFPEGEQKSVRAD